MHPFDIFGLVFHIKNISAKNLGSTFDKNIILGCLNGPLGNLPLASSITIHDQMQYFCCSTLAACFIIMYSIK